MTVGTGLVALTEALMPVGAWRTIMDCLVVILMFGTAAFWVRENRSALQRADECGCESPSLEIRYVTSERHPPRNGVIRRLRAPAHAMAIRQDPSNPGRR